MRIGGGASGGGGGLDAELTANVIPKGDASADLVDSLLRDDGTTLTYNTNKFTCASATGNATCAGTLEVATGIKATGPLTPTNGSLGLGFTALGSVGYISCKAAGGSNLAFQTTTIGSVTENALVIQYDKRAIFSGPVEMDGALDHDGSTVGFYGTAPIAKQTGVAVTAAAIHAALVALGLISA